MGIPERLSDSGLKWPPVPALPLSHPIDRAALPGLHCPVLMAGRRSLAFRNTFARHTGSGSVPAGETIGTGGVVAPSR